jgi:hypothetical protein
VQQIYGELNCAGNYLIPEAAKILPQSKTDIILVNEKHFDSKKGEYRQRVKLTG